MVGMQPSTLCDFFLIFYFLFFFPFFFLPNCFSLQ